MRLGLGFGLMLSLAAPAAAGELENFVAAKNGAMACWSRQYDSKHLSAHPDQTVSAMTFGLQYQTPKAGNANSPYQYILSVQGKGAQGVAEGECKTIGGKTECSVECDGGGVILSPAKNGKLLVGIGQSGHIRLDSLCDEDQAQDLEAGKDDKTFLLSKAEPAACEKLFGD